MGNITTNVVPSRVPRERRCCVCVCPSCVDVSYSRLPPLTLFSSLVSQPEALFSYSTTPFSFIHTHTIPPSLSLSLPACTCALLPPCLSTSRQQTQNLEVGARPSARGRGGRGGRGGKGKEPVKRSSTSRTRGTRSVKANIPSIHSGSVSSSSTSCSSPARKRTRKRQGGRK